MNEPEPNRIEARQLGVAAPLIVIVGLALAVGLLAPLLLGEFSGREALVLALLEAACLLAVVAGTALLVRQLRASQAALREIARRDELTGVGNYRALHERLGQEIARHRRHRRQFALVLLDLDGFKQVNERYGHLDGDRLLAEVGEALTGTVRTEDSVFRQGGDEFAVIVPETNAEEAGEVAARLRDGIARRRLGDEEGVRVSAATGFAMYPADGRVAEELLVRADRDLFAAKRGER